MGTRSEQVADVIRALSAREREAFDFAYVPKSEDTFSALTYFLGAIGIHQFYLGQWRLGCLRLALAFSPLLAVAAHSQAMFGALLAVSVLWWLYDVVMHRRIVERENWKRKAAALKAIGKLV